MSTLKISVWAFNEFSKFDAFVKNGLGISGVESVEGYDREYRVKMVNSESHGFSSDLDSFLHTLKNHDDNLKEFETLRVMLFKKNGELRKLDNKTVKYITDGFSVHFHFIEDKPVLRRDLDGNVITLEMFGIAKADMMRDGLCDITFTYDDYCDQCQDL